MTASDLSSLVGSTSHPRYQPHVDGLRAVAVVPVILYHAGFTTFSGGFIGVDILYSDADHLSQNGAKSISHIVDAVFASNIPGQITSGQTGVNIASPPS